MTFMTCFYYGKFKKEYKQNTRKQSAIWGTPAQLTYEHINVVSRDFVPKLDSKIEGIFAVLRFIIICNIYFAKVF